MPRNGLLIHYEYCTGCYACVVACKQEHNYPVGVGGINVNEVVIEGPDKVHVDYFPFITSFCDLCTERTKGGDEPACVKHCQARCMMHGTVAELAKAVETKPRSVIFAPR